MICSWIFIPELSYLRASYDAFIWDSRLTTANYVPAFEDIHDVTSSTKVRCTRRYKKHHKPKKVIFLIRKISNFQKNCKILQIFEVAPSQIFPWH